MLLASILAACLLAFDPASPVVLDRIAVIVGKGVIKLSDIDRDLRITEFQNHEPLKLDAAARKKAAERLIDQQIIRQEISAGGYSRATDADADALLRQIPHSPATLARYGITVAQLKDQLLWQLTVLRFIGERFRPGVLITDDDVRKYYDQHRTEFKGTLDQAQTGIRETLESRQTDQQFETWLDSARKTARIEYRDGAFQ